MTDNTKIIITGFTDVDIDYLIKQIIYINDDLNIISKFTTNIQDESFYNKYIDPMTINLSFKNNVLLYISTINYISSGITIDDFINGDICYIDVKNFNNIPDKILNEFDILVIWLDSNNIKLTNIDKIESKFFQERINKLKYMYFLNDNISKICNTIFEYLNGDEEIKNKLLEENS